MVVLRRLRQLGAQLRADPLAAATVDKAEEFLLYSPPHPERLPYCEPTTDAICAALRTDGCAFLRAVIDPKLALELAEKLRGYVPLPHEDGRDTGTDVGPNRRSRALCRPRNLAELPAHPAVGHRIQPAGFVPDCDWSGNITTLFQRDPAFLALGGPTPVREVMDQMLGEHCHLITMKGWRHGPGHGGNKQFPAAPGVHAGGFHCDEMWLPPNLPEELATQLGPYLSNTVHIIGTSSTQEVSLTCCSSFRHPTMRLIYWSRYVDLPERDDGRVLPNTRHPRFLPLLPPPQARRDQLGGAWSTDCNRFSRRHAAVPFGCVARRWHERDGKHDAAHSGGGIRCSQSVAGNDCGHTGSAGCAVVRLLIPAVVGLRCRA